MNALSKSLLILVLILGSFAPTRAQENQSFEMMKNLEIFAATYKQLHLNYVDEIKPGELMKTAIDAMLKSLDPYTVYIPEANIEDFRILTEGQYDGIGTLIATRTDGRILISDVYEGFPAHRAGLRAGDMILNINGVPITGKTNEEVSILLKGQTGTRLTLTLERLGHKDPLSFTLTREAIKFNNVGYQCMLNKETGYISLIGFTEQAAHEVKEAIVALKQQGMKQLVLDLRDNGGGLMDQAIAIVNLFCSKGQLVVRTNGKQEDRIRSFFTQEEPLDTEMPLIVMVNGSSASSSEIVAGALQDLDRALIVGQRSFGKGLVQNILPLDYNAQMKITVAKYYIPSGRCVQALDYAHRDANGQAIKLPDSLRTAYKTHNGRTVYDGNGIEPDIETSPANMSNLTATLFYKNYFFDFATLWRSQNDSLPYSGSYEISDSIHHAFQRYLQDKDCHYTTQTEEVLDELMTTAREEIYYDAIQSTLQDLKLKLQTDKTADFEKHGEELRYMLTRELVNRYYYKNGVNAVDMRYDKELQKAVQLFDPNASFKSYLK